VAGQEDGEDLVAQLPVAHAPTGVGIARRQEHRQKVAAIDAVRPPLRQKAGHQGLELRDGAAIGRRLAPRQPLRQADEIGDVGAHVHHDLHQAPHRLDLAEHVGREHGAGDDVEGQSHHLGGHLERLRQRAPARQHGLRAGPEGVDETGDAAAIARPRWSGARPPGTGPSMRRRNWRLL
jgi:hypothetical protein